MAMSVDQIEPWTKAHLDDKSNDVEKEVGHKRVLSNLENTANEEGLCAQQVRMDSSLLMLFPFLW